VSEVVGEVGGVVLGTVEGHTGALGDHRGHDHAGAIAFVRVT
jgi:hypothetical protein